MHLQPASSLLPVRCAVLCCCPACLPACLPQVIRSNETMAKAAALEQRILRLLGDKDPENRKHVIRLLRTFEFRHHVCMVFEPLVSGGGGETCKGSRV